MKYNLEYVPLTSRLEKIVAPSVLDPDGTLGISHTEEILIPWWHERREKLNDAEKVGSEPPKHLAVLSFAGLDTGDSLCFPLLAHELGHFLAFSKPHPDLIKEIAKTSEIRPEQVQTALTQLGLNPTLDDILSRTKKLYNQTSICLRELLADLLATRMMGFSFFVAQAEFLKTLVPWSQSRVLSTGYPAGYPGIKFRLWAILRHLLIFHPHNPQTFLAISGKSEIVADPLINYLKEWSQTLEVEKSDPPKGIDDEGSNIEREMGKIAFQAVKSSLAGITKLAQDIVPDAVCAELTPLFFERIMKLTKYLPPSCANENSQSFSEIMSAAWAYQILYGEERELKKRTSDEKYAEYEKTCNLVLKAIELIPASEAIDLSTEETEASNGVDGTEWLNAKGALSADHIRKRIELSLEDDSHLAVLPIDPKAIKGASLDVHLGNWFSYAKRTKLSGVKIDDPAEKELLTIIGREEVFIEKDFLLHPGDLVLGATQEFIGLPNDVMAFVEGKSGLGRLGLFVATATQVAPGYHGVIVLELANAGTVPLKLSPGMKIAQLVFQVMTEKTPPYDGEYQCQIKP